MTLPDVPAWYIDAILLSFLMLVLAALIACVALVLFAVSWLLVAAINRIGRKLINLYHMATLQYYMGLLAREGASVTRAKVDEVIATCRKSKP